MSDYSLCIVGVLEEVQQLKQQMENYSHMFDMSWCETDKLAAGEVPVEGESTIFAVFDPKVAPLPKAKSEEAGAEDGGSETVAEGDADTAQSDDAGDPGNEEPKVELSEEEQLCLLEQEKKSDAFFKLLKKSKVLKKHPYLVITHRDDIDYISQCHEWGAYDVVPANQSSYELSLRLISVVYNYERQQKTEKKLKNAQKVAFDAMEDSSELGRVLHYVNSTNQAQTFDELAAVTFETFKQLHIHGALMYHKEEQEPNINYFADDEKARPIEIKIMNSYRENYMEAGDKSTISRFLTFGTRVVAVGDYTTLLIRDADEERQGRLRDILSGIVNGLDARAHFIIVRDQEERRQVMLKDLIDSVKTAMGEFQMIYDSSEMQALTIMDDFMLNLNSGLSELGLTNEQEDFFRIAAEDTMNALVGQYSNQVELNKHLESILSQMQQFSKHL